MNVVLEPFQEFATDHGHRLLEAGLERELDVQVSRVATMCASPPLVRQGSDRSKAD